ncbi:MAG: NADH-quinone oxidoreductase subunit NuoE [Proteobacteria bacterium]|nr:NADH-quinone oxidoreductase subunit NuoE [Pseudomonadota bacterium]
MTVCSKNDFDSLDAPPFCFTEENEKKAQNAISHYPQGREASAVLALLDLAQRQIGGWLTREALMYISERLNMPLVRLYEIVGFYTMFRLKPCGKYLVQICTTTPCWLRDCEKIYEAFQKELGISFGETTENGLFTLEEVECLGACVNAPVVQINDDYYEDLTSLKVDNLLKQLCVKKEKQ